MDKACALVTEGRLSGGPSGLSIGHISPEAAAGRANGLVEDGDIIEIDIAQRSTSLMVDDATLGARWTVRDTTGWHPAHRERPISAARRAYAALALSADQGAARQVD